MGGEGGDGPALTPALPADGGLCGSHYPPPAWRLRIPRRLTAALGLPAVPPQCGWCGTPVLWRVHDAGHGPQHKGCERG